MIKINLLSKSSIKKEEKKELVVLLTILMLLSFSAIIYAYFSKVSTIEKIKVRTLSAQAELGKYEAIVSQVNEVESAKAQLVTRKNVINGLMKKGTLYPQFMSDLVKVVPPGMSIISLSTVLISDDGLEVSMSGQAVDNYPIADFIAGMAKKEVFSNIELGAITISSTDKAIISSFSLTFVYQRKIK
ncbi:PilN domain-containing protein [Elusimicrobiota bacterium]